MDMSIKISTKQTPSLEYEERTAGHATQKNNWNPLPIELIVVAVVTHIFT